MELIDTTQKNYLYKVKAMPDEELFLVDGYVENEPRSLDEHNSPFWPEEIRRSTVQWQVPVYKLCRRLAEQLKPACILDIGCGTGFKLANYLGDMAKVVVGVDQASGIRMARARFPNMNWIEGNLTEREVWQELRPLAQGIVICSDVIEHVERPRQLLLDIRAVMSPGSTLVISTPDRNVLERARTLGPPLNPRHMREWSMDEMTKLLTSTGYVIVEKHHLFPREYVISIREAARLVYRLATSKAIPDTRSSMAFVLNKYSEA